MMIIPNSRASRALENRAPARLFMPAEIPLRMLPPSAIIPAITMITRHAARSTAAPFSITGRKSGRLLR